MTIVAGLVCQDGLVLCADAEMTGTVRLSGRKTWFRDEGPIGNRDRRVGDYVNLDGSPVNPTIDLSRTSWRAWSGPLTSP